MKKKNILLVNSSCKGASGNTAELLELATQYLIPYADVAQLVLDAQQN